MGATEKTCKSCGETKHIDQFRVHKNGYALNKCKSCEKSAWTSRYELLKSKKNDIFNIVTKTGESFEVSSKPIEGGKKICSSETDKVLYVKANINRDKARSIFQSYANVNRTGISVTSLV